MFIIIDETYYHAQWNRVSTIGTSVLTDVATDNVRKDEASIDSIREGF